LDYENERRPEGDPEMDSDAMWESFQKEEGGTMRFYRKGLNDASAKKALNNEQVMKKLAPAPAKSAKSEAVWITMSIKHARGFKTTETANPYCVAYTINMDLFKKAFKANEILNFIGKNKDKASKVNNAMTNPFPLFEDQQLENHGLSKVNLGLFGSHVTSFNECVKSAEMLKQVTEKKDNKNIYKMKKVTLNQESGEIQEEEEEERSETSTK